MGNIRAYLLRRRELCAYVIAGVIVTGVNYTIYSILTVFCGLGISVSNISAWAVSVFVAFLLNKAFVFQKQDWSFKTMFHEGTLFVGSRLLSGAVGIGLVPLFMVLGITQSVLGIPGFAAKFLAETVSMLLSYFPSKYAIFK